MAPPMRVLPAIVRRAAEGVRTARSKSEALRAIRVAIGDIHAHIDLLRVEDPDAKAQTTREANLTVDTLVVARDSLERATNL